MRPPQTRAAGSIISRGRSGETSRVAPTEFFGDKIGSPKSDNSFRIMGCNVGGLPSSRQNTKYEQMRTLSNLYDVDVLCISEPNLAWQNVPVEERFQEKIRGWWDGGAVYTAGIKTTQQQVPFKLEAWR
jgi:hypothetical protein